VAKRLIAFLALALSVPAGAELTEQVDLKKPERPTPGAGEAMIVLRAHAPGMVGDNRILYYRYDGVTGQIIKDALGKPNGAKVTYSYSLFGGKKGEKALRIAIVPAGDYVLGGRTFNLSFTDVFCFGAPRFTLKPGEIVYVGDYEMFALEKMPDGERRNAMRYTSDLENARGQFSAAYPMLAPRLIQWASSNGATFACDGDEFTAYAVPGEQQGN